jgi:hypothetical protein
MTKKIFFFSLILFLGLATTSCNKGCDFPEDENLGAIVTDAIVFGGNTGGIATVHAQPSGQYDLKVSFDNGYTYNPVDFDTYTVFNFPVTAGCNSHYERDISVLGSTVKYKITVESCPDCEEEYRTDNWVLVRKSSLPTNFTVSYEKKVK